MYGMRGRSYEAFEESVDYLRIEAAIAVEQIFYAYINLLLLGHF